MKSDQGAGLNPAWELCEACEDYLCNIHPGLHVHECDCPYIDEWIEISIDPYSPCVDLNGNLIADKSTNMKLRG